MKKGWTTEQIREGFERFRAMHGRLPTSPEIDQTDYLPSSRQIQRKFGGLESLRKQLGYEDTNFGKGSFRGKIASRVNTRGRNAELSLEKSLREKFGEVFVHTEKIFDNSKNRVDFYIYSPNGNFGVDIFSTDTMRDLQKNVNIKIDKYQNFPLQLFLLVDNDDFVQEDIDAYALSKVKKLPDNVRIVTDKTFFQAISSKQAYNNPL